MMSVKVKLKHLIFWYMKSFAENMATQMTVLYQIKLFKRINLTASQNLILTQ